MHLNRLYHKPCGTLDEVSDGSVDVVVTSPPYNLGQRKRQRGKLHTVLYDGFDDCLPHDEYVAQQIDLINSAISKLKPDGSMFYSHKPRAVKGNLIDPHDWVGQANCRHYQTIVWDRASTHNHERTRLYPVCEYIFHLYRPEGKPRVNRECAAWTNIWRMSWAETRNVDHPAAFPEELPWRCLKLADVPPGGVVLDPYLGSGTTAVVAVTLGLHCIGYEISGRYIRMAKERIRCAVATRKLEEQAVELARRRDRHGEAA